MTPHDVDAAYTQLGYQLGWRFMTAPQRTLATSPVAIVGLNPGGTANYERSLDECWSTEAGSAYVVEQWPGRRTGGDPLQVQVQRLCRLLGLDPNQTFSGQFVPFRSNSWANLPRRTDAVEFARGLWRWAFDQSPAKLVICLGKDVTAKNVAAVLDAEQVPSMPSGWGDLAIDRYVSRDNRLVLGLPHLGRFQLFGKTERDDAFLRAVNR